MRGKKEKANSTSVWTCQNRSQEQELENEKTRNGEEEGAHATSQ